MSSFRGNFNSAQGQSSFLVAFPQLLDLTLDHFYDFAQQFYFFNRILTAVINKNNVRTENNRRSRIIVYNLFSKICIKIISFQGYLFPFLLHHCPSLKRQWNHQKPNTPFDQISPKETTKSSSSISKILALKRVISVHVIFLNPWWQIVSKRINTLSSKAFIVVFRF